MSIEADGHQVLPLKVGRFLRRIPWFLSRHESRNTGKETEKTEHTRSRLCRQSEIRLSQCLMVDREVRLCSHPCEEVVKGKDSRSVPPLRFLYRLGISGGLGGGRSRYFIEMFSESTISHRRRTQPVLSSHSVRICPANWRFTRARGAEPVLMSRMSVARVPSRVFSTTLISFGSS